MIKKEPLMYGGDFRIIINRLSDTKQSFMRKSYIIDKRSVRQDFKIEQNLSIVGCEFKTAKNAKLESNDPRQIYPLI